MKRFVPLLWLILIACSICAQERASSTKLPSINEKVAGMQKFPGYFPFYWDAKAGKVWLEIDKWNSEFLYVESMPAGIAQTNWFGSSERGQSYIVRFGARPSVLLMPRTTRTAQTATTPTRVASRRLRRIDAVGLEVTRDDKRVRGRNVLLFARRARRARNPGTFAAGNFSIGSHPLSILSR